MNTLDQELPRCIPIYDSRPHPSLLAARTRYNSMMIDENRSETALEVINVTKVFTTKAGIVEALRGINFVITKGEFVSIVGPSGRASPPC